MFPLRTEITSKSTELKIGLSSQVLTIGSCFSEVIGNKLIENKLKTLSNPFGTVFNPLSISRLLRLVLGSEILDKKLITENQGVWHHYDFHSSVWGKTKDELIANCKQKIEEVRLWLQQTDVLILTYGTAFAYFLKEQDLRLVSNCHKTPSSHFTKTLLDVPHIIDDFEATYHQLKAFNPNLNIVLTVSPVRHTKDTLELNQVSKSILKLAVYYLTERFKNLVYFPSYEIMLDDLRDYRFYKPDLIHPNELAEAYIYEKFEALFFEKELIDFIKNWKPVSMALRHRSQYEGTASHYKFLEDLLQKLLKLNSKVYLEDEILDVKNKLLVYGK